VSWLPDRALARLAEVAALPELPDRYELHEPIGAGGMGVVFRATDRELERAVAVKVARVQIDPAHAERLRAEARVLASLEHPGIVPVHDVGILPDGRFFYVMKLVRGETLTSFLRIAPGLLRRLAVFERVAETVAFAHERGIVHRDLKPDNIMVGAFGEVLVLDWGVAKLLARSTQPPDLGGKPLPGHTQPGTVLGTPGFMPPEQARGAASEVDRRADVYALGALLELLLQDERVPKRLRAICTHALALEPADRYPDAATLLADLTRFRAGGAVRAYHEGFWERWARIMAPYRTAIVLIVAYILMRVLVALIWR
jgi:serine/threonine protein kinase